MREIRIGDGGMGSELRLRGFSVPSHVESIWSAHALEADPEAVIKIHADYLRAGAHYITINNYAVTRPILARAHLAHELTHYTQRAVELGREAIARVGRPGVQLAASLPPLQTSYRPDLMLSELECLAQYAELVRLLAPKVDILICETMSSGLEARCALQAALARGAQCEVWLSWTLHGVRNNHLPSGKTIEQAFAQLGGHRPDAFLINCCAANFITKGLDALRQLTDLPLGGYGNAENIRHASHRAGENQRAEESQRQHKTPLDEAGYLREVHQWVNAGASIVGGCCRTRPSYIAAMSRALQTT